MDVINDIGIDFNIPQTTQNGCLNFGDFEINCRYIKGIGGSLIVAFDGWDPEKEYDTTPTYSKWKYFKGLGESCLYISHPIYKGVKVSHSIYTAILNFIKSESVIFKLIKLTIAENQYRNKDIIFYGGSAGAFAAIQYSLLFPRSKCCVINPETSVTAHEGHLIRKYMNLVFEDNEGNPMLEVSSLNLKSVLVKKSALPHLFIYQNFKDYSYYSRHFIPFMEAFRSRAKETESGSLTISEFSENNGHSANISNKRINAAFGILKAAMNRSKGAAECHSRMLYRRMSDLEFKVSFRISLDNIPDELLENIFIVFYEQDRDRDRDSEGYIKKIPLSRLSKVISSDKCTYSWSNNLPVGAQYVYLVADEYDLSSSIVRVKEFIHLDTV